MRDSDTEAYQEDGDRPSSSFQCDAEIQVTPDRKNARVQTSTKMKTIGERTQQEFSYNDYGTIYYFVGTQVKPGVCSVGVQCSESQIHTHVQDVGVQCSLMAPVRHSTSVFLPSTSSPLPSDASQSESEMSQGDFEIPDLDTSAYTMQDDSSS